MDIQTQPSSQSQEFGFFSLCAAFFVGIELYLFFIRFGVGLVQSYGQIAGMPVALIIFSFFNGIMVGLISRRHVLKKGLIICSILFLVAISYFYLKKADAEKAITIVLINLVILFIGVVFSWVFYTLSKRVKIILGAGLSLLFLYWILFGFFRLGVAVHLDIEPTKKTYALGETIIATTTITNYSIFPYTRIFSSGDTEPVLSVSGLEKPMRGFLAAAAFTHVSIPPFGSKKYTTSLTLINPLSEDNYIGSSINYDLVVRPGKNEILSEWSKKAEATIYVDPQTFIEAHMECEDFKDEDRKSRCYDSRARREGDTAHCDKIKDSYSQGRCYTEKAKKEKNFSWCDSIRDDQSKSSCLKEKAISTRDFSICPTLKKYEGLYEMCQTAWAQDANDPSICEYIENLTGRASCLRALGINPLKYKK